MSPREKLPDRTTENASDAHKSESSIAGESGTTSMAQGYPQRLLYTYTYCIQPSKDAFHAVGDFPPFGDLLRN